MTLVDAKRVKELKDYLKAHGHKAGKVDALSIKTNDDLRRAVCDLHGVSENEYRRATGK